MSELETQVELEHLQNIGEAPLWLNLKGYTTLSKGYRLRGETPKGMYKRVAAAAAELLEIPDLQDKFFDYMWRGWLCPASPVLSNLGTSRGLPISCFGIDIQDSLQDIMGRGIGELAALTKAGGGVGVGFERIRPKGSPISEGANGNSDGIIPFAKVYDSAIIGTNQGNVRRGAASINLDITHGDWEEFIKMRRPENTHDRQCGNLHHCTTIKDNFMWKVVNGKREERSKWAELMKTRFETGESYIMWHDAVNDASPAGYKYHGLDVSMTNICSEITLHTDQDHSFICCLSSLNLTKWDEWKDTDLPEIATYFLNGVLNEFINKAKGIPGLEKARASAIKGRAIGIGVLGWHSYLQENMLPFGGFQAMTLNNKIFSTIKRGAEFGSRNLAQLYGEPEWCTTSGLYNSHLLAVAPTRSNSIISGGVSAGIEPIISNVFADKTAKGVFFEKNKTLQKVLDRHGYDDEDTWNFISSKKGSVQELDILNDEEKAVFRTAYEIDQKAIIRQAAQRQKYICQAQSLNTFFPHDTDAKYFNDCHILAWKLGLKTLYYCRSTSGLSIDRGHKREATIEECETCSG